MGPHHHQPERSSAVSCTDHPQWSRVLGMPGKKRNIPFTKEGNCFTQIENSPAIASMAETLLSERASGLLSAVCERCIYKACLCFGLDNAERRRSRFRYEYSTFQLEYSRNLLFKRGSEMAQVMDALVDRNRSRLDVKRLRTILGRKNRPHCRKKKSPQLQVTVERPAHDLTVFKVYCGNLALKIYTKGERVLRAEAIAN